jgi:protein translocase SecG subunit
MNVILPIIQIILSILLIILILLQRTGTGIEGALGGGDSSTGINRTRRGSELFIFRATIAIAVLFAASAFIAVLI